MGPEPESPATPCLPVAPTGWSVQKGSASPLSARPRERLLLAPLAHARHTSGTSAAGPAMPPDSSPPASVAPTGIYKDLVRGGYLEARGQQ